MRKLQIKKSNEQLTAVLRNWGFGLDFKVCFVLLWSVI